MDCSHANSGKDPLRQPHVLRDLLAQRQQQRDPSRQHIVGVMLESHLEDGRQGQDKPLAYGVSITDGCLGWEKTCDLLQEI